jgi:AraC-like DNA-binding protein
MTHTPRLDRLSALLGGLAPRVQVMRPGSNQQLLRFPAEPLRGLWLHLVLEGAVALRTANGEHIAAQAPAMVICRVDASHELMHSNQTLTAPDALLCARAHLEGPVAPLLLAEFVQPLVVPLADADLSLQQVISLVRAEMNEPRCGQPLLLDRAGDILFIGLLRHLVAHPRTDGAGLFHGLSDQRIAGTLVALHAEPQAEWHLETMAERAGMSRTAFSNRFRAALNTTPGKYLAQLRLAIAQRAMASGDGLKAAARRTGYSNASALSRALSKARAQEV